MSNSSKIRPEGLRAFFSTYKNELRFVLLFAALLGSGFTVISLQPVNDHFIEPFTGMIAKASGVTLNLLGQDVTMAKTRISTKKFAVNVKNGCNGVETMIIFLSAVLAFPAPWRAKTWGLVLGILLIQLVNLIRVVALFLTGVYLPSLFNTSHTVIWQTIVILFGVLLWIFWAGRFAQPHREPAAT
jgi:exosortase H (IPTLxxWG-CTERM-specific)